MKKTSSAFYAGAAFLIALASFLYAWKFIIPNYSENKATLANLESEIGDANKKLESLKTAKNTLDQLGELPDQLFVSIPEDKDMPNLITELEALAGKYKIVIPAIQVSDGGTQSSSGNTASAATGTTANAASPNAVSISFAVDGSFEELSGLISSLEKDIRFVNIKSASISAGEEGSLALSLELEAFKRNTGVATSSTSASPDASSATSSTNNINTSE